MLSHKVLTRQDVGRLASYYEDSADDYYAKEGDASQWQGKGARALGLSGAVDSVRFRSLLAGEIKPGIHVRAATRHDSHQRIGIDLTFSAPKSVSIQALIGGDSRIIQAHDRAVQRTVAIAEKHAQARKKIHGKGRVETTGNLIVATFRHETSRERDPQLHTHAVVLNLTQRHDGEWRALKNDEIIKMTRYLGAAYRAELAIELQELGYEIRHERDGLFELSHISRAQLEGFSQRGTQIEERLTAQGLTRETATTGQKQQATMQSRAKKVSVEREAIYNEWVVRAKDFGIDFNRRTWAGEGRHAERVASFDRPADVAIAEAAKCAVRFALNHLTERQTVVTERVLIDTAMKQGMGAARLVDIERELNRLVASGYLIREDSLYQPADQPVVGDAPKTRSAWLSELTDKGLDRETARTRIDTAIEHGGLVPCEPRYTTQTALEREKRILKIERDGRAMLTPIVEPDRVRSQLATGDLNPGQRDAVALIASTCNRVVGVQGFAGTGKSHMLDTAKTIIEASGYQVLVLAPYGAQVKALRELGVTAKTVASFLRAKDKLIDARTVLVIDESGVVPTRLMEQTLKLAENAGTRVVLIGDIAQTKAIEAGRPFEQLQRSGMQTAHMEEIQRQKDPALKAAVELAARGQTGRSLARISGLAEHADDSARRAAIVDDYMKFTAAERDKTLVVTGTNDARREINARLRDALGTAGQGIEFDTLIRRDTTQAERRFSKHYRVGDVIQPEKDYKKIGLARGVLYEVVDTGPGNRLTVRAASGERVEFSPMTHRKISVYQPERAELATGDVVRVTRNDAALDLANGDRLKVECVQTGRMTLTDGKRRIELSTDKPLHLDHAYATTVHGAQGLTADRVLVDADTKSFTTSKDVYYVAISRARLEARVYTDSLKELPAAIARVNHKLAALDLTRTSEERNKKSAREVHRRAASMQPPEIKKRSPSEREY